MNFQKMSKVFNFSNLSVGKSRAHNVYYGPAKIEDDVDQIQ